MKKTFRAASVAIFAALVGMTAAIVLPAATADAAPRVSTAVVGPLQEAQALANAKDFQGALVKVREAEAIPDKTDFDQYAIDQFLGFVAANLADYPTAAGAYGRMADSEFLAEQDRTNTTRIAMILHYQIKDYPKALAFGAKLAALGPMDAEASAVYAQSFYFTGNYAEAKRITEESIRVAEAAGKQPADLLQVLATTQLKMGDQAGGRATIEKLVLYSDAPEYWSDLITLSEGQKGMTDRQALQLYRLRNATGALKRADDYEIMAGLAIQLGVPNEAKTVLEDGMAKGNIGRGGKASGLLSKAQAATVNDKASLPAFEREAKGRSSGEADVRLGETYWTHGRFAEAETAIRRGIAKGKLKDPNEAQLLLGIALVKQNKLDEAIAAFSNTGGSYSSLAHLWTLFAKRKANVAKAQTTPGG